ncbi:LOW QUALITY PROTEIN: hypothetical protein RJ639_000049 [Escallonia herrerae]|uniref:Uncharacterized protein n=1 Tax=Escallonia herrerae TaxID=1293975 RepID=A0AA88XRA0_9ASTE|nr:LOW QUALITY PROTEIN: hypothetical protein RJ639_000049 [Escallonia herrerae]
MLQGMLIGLLHHKAGHAKRSSTYIPGYVQSFEVHTDAFDFALGGDLMRECHPVAYKSRKLNEAKCRYTTHEKDLLTEENISKSISTVIATDAIDALRQIKDEAEDKFDEDTWFSSDEKRNKMTKESIVKLLKEFSLLPPFSAQVPALQEPANYGTDLETSVYEGQIRSGYRVPMHPFTVAFFNHYKMSPSQLVPNGWRKLVGLIYLYKLQVMVHDFMRLYLEVCLMKNVANGGGWYYIHNRVRVIKDGPKSNKGWHSRYFFIQRPSGKWGFPRKWNGFYKDYEKKGFLAPNASTKKMIDHIKRRGGLNIDEPLTDQEMWHAGLIPPAPTMPVPPTPIVESRVVLGHMTQGLAI